MSSKYDPNAGDWVERVTDSFFSVITIGLFVLGIVFFAVGVIVSMVK